MDSLFQVFEDRQEQVIKALLEHIQLSLIALIMAVVIAVPLGIFLTRREKIAEGIIGASAVLQTIPSLALLGLLIPLVGIGKVPAIIALVVYALLPILRNTYTGIKEIDTALVEAAKGMGMTSLQRLVKVELPLAFPVMMAGIRTAMVLIVGTATLAALIGAGGLGEIILLGIDRNDHLLILLGAIPAALLALIFDGLLRIVEKISSAKSMRTTGIVVVIVFMIMAAPMLATKSSKADLVIAGKLGSEPEILINMYKLLIEEYTDLEVELKPGFGKTSFVFNALEAGEVDIYPEFTGTALFTFLKETNTSNEKAAVYKQAAEGMEKEFGMKLLQPMAFNNTYALATTKELAAKHNLQTISDLKKVQTDARVGFTLEFSDREDGYKGMQDLYHLTFAQLKTMEPKLRYTAIEANEIDVIDAYATDSELAQYNLHVLHDDLSLFPPYQGAPLMKKETLAKYPELEGVLNKLAGKIIDDEMRKMNYLVNVEGESAADIAKDFLQEKELISK
ncbi:ABC transporter permease/substrate-binding protein [Priestia taiwanensis]|uniref:Probable ergothioneine transporter EgtUBC n=1 Tax=Priestia taiwanensis TaxID=1347902 RepID=A0A917ESL0_9BACI|nr:ABC transporter permease/substrate-binding protein [Priestia taiwanensis]MBM7364970.1 osmoprotectant transport system permease protein [Priestia taiwanensis]GGE82116.1 ABC transporter permease [Priestia taiwanensis]